MLAWLPEAGLPRKWKKPLIWASGLGKAQVSAGAKARGRAHGPGHLNGLSLSGHNHAHRTPRRPRKSTGWGVDVAAEGRTRFLPQARWRGPVGLQACLLPGTPGQAPAQFMPSAIRGHHVLGGIHRLVNKEPRWSPRCEGPAHQTFRGAEKGE